jgi:hypothetical protein
VQATAAQGTGDAAPLQALAWVVGRLADDVRAAAARAGTTAGVEWTSVAADGFRRSLAEHADDVRRCSAAVDEAAAALAAHAAAVARPGLLHLAARVLG